MKPQDLRKLTIEQLLELRKQLEFQLFKASSEWGLSTAKDLEKKKARNEYNSKNVTIKGTKTSLRKDLRRNIARVNTILEEMERQ
jgi:ribosomal protein L29